MRRFACPVCGSEVFFDSHRCESCRSTLRYAPDDDDFVGGESRAQLPSCASASTPEACNWLPDVDGPSCRSCRLDQVHQPSILRAPFQSAKRRTVRQLLNLGVDLGSIPPLSFALVEGRPGEPVTTGHADGVITIDVSEGDPATLEQVREDMGEAYRTPLGHIRHELGHWYWQSHLGGTFTIDDFRRRFGDERADYADALAAHYAAPDDGSWQRSHISHYAAAHPWEDFAESFAHLLHLLDTLETARAHAMVGAAQSDFDSVWARWVELTTALNDLNRAMGTPDAYPFVASRPAIDKVRFIARALSLGPEHLEPVTGPSTAPPPRAG